MLRVGRIGRLGLREGGEELWEDARGERPKGGERGASDGGADFDYGPVEGGDCLDCFCQEGIFCGGGELLYVQVMSPALRWWSCVSRIILATHALDSC
jgi:hypothetical protein